MVRRGACTGLLTIGTLLYVCGIVSPESKSEASNLNAQVRQRVEDAYVALLNALRARNEQELKKLVLPFAHVACYVDCGDDYWQRYVPLREARIARLRNKPGGILDGGPSYEELRGMCLRGQRPSGCGVRAPGEECWIDRIIREIMEDPWSERQWRAIKTLLDMAEDLDNLVLDIGGDQKLGYYYVTTNDSLFLFVETPQGFKLFRYLPYRPKKRN